ncbi:Hypothetical protein D9617_87g078080 [Elsinoe fawcettii]|nr:Hypothetical protein D9617_87g078080 [Elsinoe fawcettii]
MVRQELEIDKHRPTIIEWLEEQHWTHEDVLQALQERGINISSATLRRRFRLWRVSTRPKVFDTPELRQRMHQLFFDTRVTDRVMVTILTIDGFTVNLKGLRRIRREMGLWKQVAHGDEAAVNRDLALLDALKEEFGNGRIEAYGRNSLYTYMRARYNISPHVRNRSMAYPEDFERRRRRLRVNTKVNYPVGPNFAWHLDAHCKFEHWGIQIYGAIDAYSRQLVWIYCGLSARTQTSVAAQYTAALAQLGIAPLYLVTDRGGETTKVADIHYDISNRIRADSEQPERRLSFQECFRYGTSRTNQRIEVYWSAQTRQLNPWRIYFCELVQTGG